MNSVNLIGRLVWHPEIRQMENGRTICKMRLAVADMGGPNRPGYINVTTFDQEAVVCAQVLREDSLVAVTGRLEYLPTRSSEGETQDGHGIVGSVDFLSHPGADTHLHEALHKALGGSRAQ